MTIPKLLGLKKYNSPGNDGLVPRILLELAPIIAIFNF